MPLVLECTDSTGLAIDVTGVSPCRLASQSLDQIKATEILVGNKSTSIGDCFRVSGSTDQPHFHFTGSLENVHHIGAGMSSGQITADGSVGRHLGSGMSGGVIRVDADAGDFVGFEMTGGKIIVGGNAADHVGSCYPGAPFGMNRGLILIRGSAGDHAGYRMRRGTIVIGGDVGESAAWQMRAGTLIVGGKAKSLPGVDMKRGTIVLGKGNRDAPSGTFLQGSTAISPTLAMLGRWLQQDHGDEVDLAWLSNPFVSWHGDRIHGSKGELFVMA